MEGRKRGAEELIDVFGMSGVLQSCMTLIVI